ncbi:hypothetical protein LCGC14_2780290 [marine sediment metagenome]|uniref:Uncharacterized protein n=1 Tax=marine sediment metagenome TaxID=412755 RepID=A0A0F8ZFK3_9ZZZZ
MGDFKKMQKAYGASAKIMEKKMEKERPLDLEILKKVKKEQKVSQPVDNSKVNVHIHNYLGSALNANPSKEAGRLINDREALSNL